MHNAVAGNEDRERYIFHGSADCAHGARIPCRKCHVRVRSDFSVRNHQRGTIHILHKLCAGYQHRQCEHTPFSAKVFIHLCFETKGVVDGQCSSGKKTRRITPSSYKAVSSPIGVFVLQSARVIARKAGSLPLPPCPQPFHRWTSGTRRTRALWATARQAI